MSYYILNKEDDRVLAILPDWDAVENYEDHKIGPNTEHLVSDWCSFHLVD